MKKVTITIGLLLLFSCTSQRGIIYKSNKVNKSVLNLETMKIWIQDDLKKGVNINKYNSLLNQNIYNLQRCINPRRSHKHSSQFTYLKLQVYDLELLLEGAMMTKEISEPRYEFILLELKEIKNAIKKIENGWN